ncbi:MAG: very short patch repair endonuclease [Flavobacteriales bacterium]|nr:very short patch repair endonuclease [Flavobacteriales bacterium]
MAYVRDGRSPRPKDERTSALMSRIKAKNTGPELLLRELLRTAGHTGYRLHYQSVPGRPDITFVGKRVAIFVHGCFWHGCPLCQPPPPKSNASFWRKKLSANKARDARKSRALRQAGWSVVVIRECQLRKRPQQQLERVLRYL